MRPCSRRRVEGWLATAVLVLGCGGGEGTPGGIDADTTGGPDAATECPQPPPPPESCDFFLGCGCDTAAGEKCSIVGDARACSAAGAGSPGTICDTDGDCAGGTSCLTWGGLSTCMVFCDEVHPCPAEQGCYIDVNDEAVPPNLLGTVCGEICVLLDQDCTLAGQACYPSRDVPQSDRGVCFPSGTLGQGEACASANDCLPGFTCINTDGPVPTYCAAFCDIVDDNPGCATGTCAQLTGHTQTGVCVTP